MPSSSRTLVRRSIAIGVLAAAVVTAFPGAVAFADNTLTLRVNDVKAEPGALVAVVARTYAPRGLSQGEICLGASSPTKSALGGSLSTALSTAKKGSKSDPGPFVALESVYVAGESGNATTLTAFDKNRQEALVQFASPSGYVNSGDGPLAVFYFRLSSAYTSYAEFDLSIDLGDTYFIDANGEWVEIVTRPGRLEIQPGGDPLRLEALGDRVDPGGTAELGIESHDARDVAFGSITLTYDPAFAAGPPEVTMTPQGGQVDFAVDTSEPGRVLLSFESLDGPLQIGPGQFVSIRLPTAAGAPSGKSPIVLDAGSTYVVDPEGSWLALDLRDAELEIK